MILMAQEHLDTRRITEELNSLKKKINQIEIAVAQEKKDNILREMFGTFKFDKPVEEVMEEIDKDLYND
ncbi:MAG: hypothetical protein RL557_148 [archaeon]|jgi:hypothetical protein